MSLALHQRRFAARSIAGDYLHIVNAFGGVAMPDTTCHMSISLDGFVAGPDQSREHPLGKRGRELHGWHLGDERANEADETAVGWLMRPRGAYVMGRNMFGPIRGEWEEDWRGWWGPEPPYHAPVFVLTHHAREPIEMEGGTTFHFVTDGFDAAYAQARETAGDDGVDIAGGASTVRQALVAGVVDELTLDLAPVLLGPASGSSTASDRSAGARRGAAFAAGHAHPLPPGELKARLPIRPPGAAPSLPMRTASDHSASASALPSSGTSGTLTSTVWGVWLIQSSTAFFTRDTLPRS